MSEAERPLTPLSYDVLLALADRPRHGYGIIKEIESRTEGRVSPSTGALYLALQRMEAEGLLEEAAGPPPGEGDDARRRYYRLTANGREAAVRESRRLAARLGVAVAKRLITPADVRVAPGRGRDG